MPALLLADLPQQLLILQPDRAVEDLVKLEGGGSQYAVTLDM